MRRRVVALGLVAVCLAACTPGGAETPSPSPSVSPVSASPTVTPTPSATPSSPSPTPSAASERELAVKSAEKVFVQFLRQSDRLAQHGGADQLPASLADLTTGPQTQQSLEVAREIKAGGLVSTGFGSFVNAKVESVKNLSGPTSTVILTGCIDQSGVSVTKNGKKYDQKPDYVRVTQARIERQKGTWRVYIWGGDIVPKGFTCENYS